MAVDMDSHTGLRGAAAAWIMLFHCFLFNRDLILDFQGSTLMPLFFLLSGFSLAIGYGGANCNSAEDNKMVFYRNRFARVYPTYIVCNLVALPLWFYGYGLVPSSNIAGSFWSIASNSILSIVPVSSLLCSLPIDAPGWTVATLTVMWLVFPFHLRSLKAKSNEELLRMIVNCYYLQLVLGVVLFVALAPFFDPFLAFAAATMNPLSRYPIFVMGVCAGLLALRHSPNGSSAVTSTPLDFWPKTLISVFPRSCCSGSQASRNIGDAGTEVGRAKYWVDRTQERCIYIFALTIFVSVLDIIARYAFGSNVGLLGNWWLQLLVPFVQLEIIVGLVLENKADSTIRRWLTTEFAMYLGKISMSIYLIHWTIIYYVCVADNGFRILHWPYDTLSKNTHEYCDFEYEDDGDREDYCRDDVDEFNRKRLIPMWTIPIVVIISSILAVALYYVVENPGRDLLKVRKKKLLSEGVGTSSSK